MKMQKLFLTIALFLSIIHFLSAQKVNANRLPPISTTSLACVIVYEQPNYQGRSASYCEAGMFQAPFSVKSMRVPSGYDVYSTNAGECFGGMTYTQSVIEMNQCPKGNMIAILATPSTKPIEITLRDISYTIHNGDCKRMYGAVGVSVTFEDLGLVAFAMGENDGWYNFINWEKGPVRNVVGNNSSPNLLNLVKTVRIDSRIWAKCKVNINTNLGSAHKGCDLCTDFTWNVKMPSQQTYPTNLNTAMTLYAPASGITQPMPVTRYAFDNRHSAVLYIGFRRL